MPKALTFTETRDVLGTYHGTTLGWFIIDEDGLEAASSLMTRVSDFATFLIDGDPRGDIDAVRDYIDGTDESRLIRDPLSTVPTADTTGTTPAMVCFYDKTGATDADHKMVAALEVTDIGPGFDGWEVDPAAGIALITPSTEIDDRLDALEARTVAGVPFTAGNAPAEDVAAAVAPHLPAGGLTLPGVLADAVWHIDPDASLTTAVKDRVGTVNGTGGPAVQLLDAGGMVVGGDVLHRGFLTASPGVALGEHVRVRISGRDVDTLIASVASIFREWVTFNLDGTGTADLLELARYYGLDGVLGIFAEMIRDGETAELDADRFVVTVAQGAPDLWEPFDLLYDFLGDNGAGGHTISWHIAKEGATDLTFDGQTWDLPIPAQVVSGTTTFNTTVLDVMLGAYGPGQTVLQQVKLWNDDMGTPILEPRWQDADPPYRDFTDGQGLDFTGDAYTYCGPIDRPMWVNRDTVIPNSAATQPGTGSWSWVFQTMVTGAGATVAPLAFSGNRDFSTLTFDGIGFGDLNAFMIGYAIVAGDVTGGAGPSITPIPLPVVAGQWHTIALTVDRDTDLLTVWLDGRRITGVSIEDIPLTSTGPLAFGDGGGAWGRHATFTRALTPAEVVTLTASWNPAP